MQTRAERVGCVVARLETRTRAVQRACFVDADDRGPRNGADDDGLPRAAARRALHLGGGRISTPLRHRGDRPRKEPAREGTVCLQARMRQLTLNRGFVRGAPRQAGVIRGLDQLGHRSRRQRSERSLERRDLPGVAVGGCRGAHDLKMGLNGLARVARRVRPKRGLEERGEIRVRRLR